MVALGYTTFHYPEKRIETVDHKTAPLLNLAFIKGIEKDGTYIG